MAAYSVAVTCPEGCEPGDIIFVTTKSGLDVEVEIPEGVAVGEVFDVEFEDSVRAKPASGLPGAIAPIESSGGSTRAKGAEQQRAGSPLTAWSDRFAVDGTGWSATDTSEATYRPQLSPRSQQMVATGGEVWKRMHEDHARRAETRIQREAEGQRRETQELRSRPKISKTSEQLARGTSPSKRRQRLLESPLRRAASPAIALPPEFQASRWHGRGSRSPHRVVNRLTEDAQYRQQQREIELQRQAQSQHRYSPRIPARSAELVSMLPTATQTMQSPAEARQRHAARYALSVDELIAKIRTQLRAAAHAGTGEANVRWLYQQYAKDELHGMSFTEFRSAVRTHGNVDRSLMSDKELTALYRSLAGPNGRMQLKEFAAFLNTKDKPSLRSRSPPAASTAVAPGVLEGKAAQLASLEAKKRIALASEDYETAATLRDEIAAVQHYIDDHTPRIDAVPIARTHETRKVDWAERLNGGPVPPDAMPAPIVEIIARCAEWVACYGVGFEDTLRKKHRGSPGWNFLNEGKTRRAVFYRQRLAYEQQLQSEPKRKKARTKAQKQHDSISEGIPGEENPTQALLNLSARSEPLFIGNTSTPAEGAVVDIAQKKFPKGKYKVLRRTVLRAELSKTAEAVCTLRAGDIIDVTRGMKDDEGLVWAKSALGWVVPRRDGLRVIEKVAKSTKGGPKRSGSQASTDVHLSVSGSGPDEIWGVGGNMTAEVAQINWKTQGSKRKNQITKAQNELEERSDNVEPAFEEAQGRVQSLLPQAAEQREDMDKLADILSEQLGFDRSFTEETGQQLAALSANGHPAPFVPLDEDTDVEETQEGTTQTITITCPDGVGPGDTIQLDTPNGHIDVEIPDGLEPGDEFDVEISVEKDEDDEDDAKSRENEPVELEPEAEVEVIPTGWRVSLPANSDKPNQWEVVDGRGDPSSVVMTRVGGTLKKRWPVSEVRDALIAQHLDSHIAQEEFREAAKAAAAAKLAAEQKAREATLKAKKEAAMVQAALETEKLAQSLKLTGSQASTKTSDPTGHRSGTNSRRRYSVALTPGSLDNFLQTIDLPDAIDSEEEEEMLNVVCPHDTVPGDTLYITTPDGQEIEIIVPDGVEPGDEFELDLSQLATQTASSDDGKDEQIAEAQAKKAQAEEEALLAREAEYLRLAKERELRESRKSEDAGVEAAADVAVAGTVDRKPNKIAGSSPTETPQADDFAALQAMLDAGAPDEDDDSDEDDSDGGINALLGESLGDMLATGAVAEEQTESPAAREAAARTAAAERLKKTSAKQQALAAWSCSWCQCNSTEAGVLSDGPGGAETLCEHCAPKYQEQEAQRKAIEEKRLAVEKEREQQQQAAERKRQLEKKEEEQLHARIQAKMAADLLALEQDARHDEDSDDEPSSSKKTIEVPEGVSAGDSIEVEKLDGSTVDVEIPAGLAPGDEFELESNGDSHEVEEQLEDTARVHSTGFADDFAALDAMLNGSSNDDLAETTPENDGNEKDDEQEQEQEDDKEKEQEDEKEEEQEQQEDDEEEEEEEEEEEQEQQEKEAEHAEEQEEIQVEEEDSAVAKQATPAPSADDERRRQFEQVRKVFCS